MKKMNNKGFSLVELIVVIAIMAVLVGVLAPQFMGYVEKAREATDIQNLDSTRTLVEAYVADKEGVTSVVIKIDGTGTSATYNANPSITANNGLDDGTKANKLKGNGWTTSSLEATYTVSTNSWAYTANSSKYYNITADKITAE